MLIITIKSDIMKKNMGSSDRLIRFLVAATIGALYFTGTITGIVGYVLLAVGAIFMITSFVGLCPLYSLLGIRTCKIEAS